jgi:hypothetical protein
MSEVAIDTTSYIALIFVQDSTRVDGRGLSGLAWNSSALTATYYRNNAGSATAIALQPMALGTWVTGGFVEINDSLMRGWYALGLPDAALATGASVLAVQIQGATNMVADPLRLELVGAMSVDITAALTIDTYPEPGQENPGDTISIEKKISYLYKAWRNKAAQGPETFELFNSAATIVDQKMTVTNLTTGVTKSKMVTGP